MTSLSFIDISGVGNSGKSAVGDLLREFDGIWVPHFQFEFDIMRVPGGLLDLRQNLVGDWSPIRSRAALLRFRRVVRRMGLDPKWWDLPGLMESTSQRYDRFFSGRFVRAWLAFADSLVVASYLAEWPYDDLDLVGWQLFTRKVLRRIGFRRNLFRSILLVSPNNFDQKASEVLQKLYLEQVGPGVRYVVLNNSFEPFNPVPALNMLKGARQIVVIRDPRDIYVSGLSAYRVHQEDRALIATDNDGLNKSFLGSDNLNAFASRFELYFDRLYQTPDPRVLLVRFEDLVRKPHAETSRILDFLELPPAAHARRGAHFNPEMSLKNVGLWKQSRNQDEIRRLEARLGAYLVP